MPYRIVKGTGPRPWKIINDKGETVGTSKTREKAEHSVNARMAGAHGK